MKPTRLTAWKVTYPDGTSCHFGNYGTAKAYSYGGKIEEVPLRPSLEIVKAIDPASDISVALVDELIAVVHKYSGSMLTTTAIGCIELVKNHFIEDYQEEIDE